MRVRNDRKFGLLGADDRSKAAVAIGLIAGEVDRLDLRALTFIDDESKVYAARGDRRGLRRHLDVAAANGGVGFLDGGYVPLDLRFVIGTRGMRLNETRQLVVLDLAVAVEDNLALISWFSLTVTTSVLPETLM